MKPGDEGWIVGVRDSDWPELEGAPVTVVGVIPADSTYTAVNTFGRTKTFQAPCYMLRVTGPTLPFAEMQLPRARFKPKRPPSSGEHTTGEQSILDLFKRLPATVP